GDALELEAVADVDAGRADLDAAAAIDAAAGGFSFRSARLAARFVVADVDRFVVRERALEPAVWAHDHAELFAEPAEAEPQRGGERNDDREGGGVLQRPF